ncbi:MAG: asparagine synthase C-terminal domain-containing protein, partial [Candidatus Omnitrophica bacterium]|nr:asparagine synthase C-terminal domain-containing protein [Candidatus Omnitrophota bacterium]
CGNMEKLLFVDTKTFLPEDGLCKVDRMSMLNSLEVRVPFLDHKVVEFVSSMPFKLKMRGRQSKYILKKVLKNKVPAEILKQRKLGFTIPLNSWFRNKLSDYSHDLLFSDSRLLKLVNAKYIKWILDEHIAGRQSFGSQIYALVVLELWLRESGASLSE